MTVFVVQDSIALQWAVETSYSEIDRLEILEGLSEGEQVVMSGQTALRDSARVDIIQ